MKEERTIESTHLYKGRVVQLRIDTVSLPNGRTKMREIVVHPGAVAIVPLINKRVLLVEQYRKAIERITLEIPAGTLEEGESPEECAKRELIEETGFNASHWDKLTSYYPSPGYSSEIIHIFKAQGLEKVSDAEAELPIQYMELEDVQRKIRTGEIKDSKTIIGVLMTL
ncbi:MAG: NUDIX hydrolase [archaeon]|nr:NUDIX hydrolase [archaeon]